jgi:acetyltransferase-like isoleucine patch superfamily enzyme
MNIFLYYWAKFFKKLKGKAILNSKIHPSSKVEAGSDIINSTFDRHSFCGYNCQIVNCDIGAFCSISNDVVIGGGRHPMEWVGMSPVFYEGRDSVKAKFSEHKREPNKRVVIEHDVWIGQGVLISQGVTIGTGAVIGMGSIVTKDINPYTIVGGNPAREIRKRFDDHTIKKLIESKWWDFDDDKLKEYAQFFTDPETFIKKLGL